MASSRGSTLPASNSIFQILSTSLLHLLRAPSIARPRPRKHPWQQKRHDGDSISMPSSRPMAVPILVEAAMVAWEWIWAVSLAHETCGSPDDDSLEPQPSIDDDVLNPNFSSPRSDSSILMCFLLLLPCTIRAYRREMLAGRHHVRFHAASSRFLPPLDYFGQPTHSSPFHSPRRYGAESRCCSPGCTLPSHTPPDGTEAMA